MARGASPTSRRSHPEQEPGADLLTLAMSRPAEAVARSEDLLRETTDPAVRSFAQQAIGIVLRDRGEVPAAVTALRTGLRLARVAGRPDRVADVRATLGAALVMRGRTGQGLAELDAAAAEADGVVLPRVLMRRAYVLGMLGRHREALEDVRRALPGIRRSGDLVWEARTLNNRADLHIALGAVTRAERDVVAAGALFRKAGQQLEEVHTVHNHGLVAFRKGDMPATLVLLDEAAERYAALGVDPPELALDRSVAFLAAGLTADAERVVRTALDAPSRPTQEAELRLMLARAALANGDPGQALRSARAAHRTFRRQQRPWWELQAELAEVRARDALAERGPVSPAQVAAAASVGRRLAEAGSDDAPLALILAGRLASRHERGAGRELFEAAARHRDRGPALRRATGWLARALSCDAAGDERGVLLACARGLEAIDEHQATLGSSELRALATAHGGELADLAVRVASRRGARSLLRWSERWRATTLALPRVRAPRDPRLAADLAAMRDVVRRIERLQQSGAPTAALERERARLEDAIRHRRLHASGTDRPPERFDLSRLLDALAGETSLVELVTVGGEIQALLVARGRVRRFAVGPEADAVRAVELARFTLRQGARGRRTDLRGVGERLQATLLGPLATALREESVVVSPPSRLQATPWALLPALSRRPVGVAPSAAAWVRAREAQTRPADPSAVVLIGGPGLPAAGRELLDLADRSPGAVVLSGGSATVERSLGLMSGAALVHVVAHGRFRRDNPMFSSLALDDGPLTVHDLERLDAAPRRLVLSACDSGVMAPVGAEELIGLSSALLALGTTGVVSSIAQVNDEATCTFMGDLHAGLRRHGTLAEAALEARLAAGDDPVAAATAASFVAFGV